MWVTFVLVARAEGVVLGLSNPPLSNIDDLVIFPNLGSYYHYTRVWGTHLDIGYLPLTVCACMSLCAYGTNPYIIGSHFECQQQPPSIGCGR